MTSIRKSVGASRRQAPRRIAIMHVGGIGDFVLTLSIAEALAARWPDTAIDAIARSEAAKLAARRSVIRRAIPFDLPGMHTWFAESGPVDEAVAEMLQEYDLIVQFVAGSESTFSKRLRDACAAAAIAIDPKPRRPAIHITTQWADDLGRAGLDLPEPPPPRISFTASERRESRERLLLLRDTAAGHAHDKRQEPPSLLGGCPHRCGTPPTATPAPRDRKIAILHPGSGGTHKCWPIERFETLADRLADHDIDPVFTLGPAERERMDAGLIAALARRYPLIQDGSVESDAMATAAADVFVGNDAGMTHVAAAVGIPTVALFGPTAPEVWRPMGDHVRVVSSPDDTMSGIDVDRVLRAVLASLDGPRASGREIAHL